IDGANDSATISGNSSAHLAEDGNASATGHLAVADVDAGQAHVQASTVVTDQGTFAIGTDGNWSFAVNSADPSVQALGAGDSMTKSFTVTSADGTATQTVSVTIDGANDSATISGNSSAHLAEDGNASASGHLAVADVDAGQAHVQASTVVTDQGTFAIGTDGNWSFAVNSAD
ncbi:flagellin, partial [Paramagnetospirillum kuznetsovii]